MSYSKKIESEILKKCYSSYLKTGIPKSEIKFGFDNDIRVDYFDTLDDMFKNNLIEPNYTYIGMCVPVLTDYGLEIAESLFK